MSKRSAHKPLVLATGYETSIRRTVFAALLVLVGIVATAGFWGLSRMASTIDDILSGDARLMSTAADAHAHSLNLRRFEKDTFLNVGDAALVTDYANKWDKSYRDLVDVCEEVGDRVDLVMIPKVSAARDVQFVDTLLSQIAGARQRVVETGIEAQIETAAGFLNIREIASSSPRRRSAPRYWSPPWSAPASWRKA